MSQRNEETEHEKWRRLLHPLITGMVALMAAATFYIQHKDSGNSEARLTAIEVEHRAIQQWKDKAEVRIEATGKDIATLNVQLAQVLVKMDIVIETLKEYKNGSSGRK